MGNSMAHKEGPDVSLFNILPDDVLIEIFVRVPGKDLTKSCVRVCKRWRDIIDTNGIWITKCVREHKYTPDMIHHLVDEDYKKLFFKRPYLNNLIRNHDASNGFKDWTITENGGDRWGHEEKPIGSDSVSQYLSEGQKMGENISCWCTSYGWCEKFQVIDLLEASCSTHVLDHIRPDIFVSEWYAARFDCGIKYGITVKLLKDREGNHGKPEAKKKANKERRLGLNWFDDKEVVDEWEFKDRKEAGREWFSTGHTFKNYPHGVRYISFSHRGKDTQFWAGRFGAKMTLATVIIDFSHTAAADDVKTL